MIATYNRRRLFLFCAGLAGAAGVALGAYAAHGLQGGAQELVEKASRFMLLHALALLGVALLQRPGARWVAAAGGLFIAGILLFCGALLGLGLFSWPVAYVTPFGGTSFILGWLALAISALRDRQSV